MPAGGEGCTWGVVDTREGEKFLVGEIIGKHADVQVIARWLAARMKPLTAPSTRRA